MVRDERPGVKDLKFSNELAAGCDEVINTAMTVRRIIIKRVVKLIRHGRVAAM